MAVWIWRLVGSLIVLAVMGCPEDWVYGRFREVSIYSASSSWSYLEGPVDAAVEVIFIMALGYTLSFLSGGYSALIFDLSISSTAAESPQREL